MILLLGIFATSIATATFIENDYGIETAWALIYATKWFEILQVLLAFSIIGNMYTYKMFTLKKLPILTFHLAFVVILIGSALTRYMGYEGMLNIREGTTEYRMLSSASYLRISAIQKDFSADQENVLYLSKLGGNNFNYQLPIENENVEVTYKDIVLFAEKRPEKVENGNKILTLKIKTIYEDEKKYNIENHGIVDNGFFKIYYNQKPIDNKPSLNIYTKENALFFTANFDMNWYERRSKIKGSFTKNREYVFDMNKLYFNDNFIVTPYKLHQSAKIKTQVKPLRRYNGREQGLSALVLNVKYKGETKEVALLGKGKQYRGYDEYVSFGDTVIKLQWGSKIIKLPFSLHLSKFVLDKYAGSKSPSSYESKVVLIDERVPLQENHRIYMNNTLTYDGYTFFQSSYDKDEKGTILSVNKDPGKWPTYLGYFLLIFGLVANLLNPNSRFMKLTRTKYTSCKKISSILLIALFMTFLTQPLMAEQNGVNYKNTRTYINQLTNEQLITEIKKIDAEHANNFSEILIQTNNGRIQPIDTFAIDAINKITSKSSLFGLSYNQALLGMLTKPKHWQRIDLFKVKHSKIKKILGIDVGKTKFSYIDIFSAKGEYKINEAVTEAIRAKPSNRGTFEKELIKIDERLNVAYSILEGDFFKVFPVSTLDYTWYAPKNIGEKISQNIKNEIKTILRKSFLGLKSGYENSNWTLANEAVEDIKKYQLKYSSKIMPNKVLQDAEILYNKLGIFQKLFPIYLICGLVLLIMLFTKLVKPNTNFKVITKIVFSVLILAFIVHTLNLGLRWYIAGHAPWSNSYEAMLYISWTIVLAGLLFSKNSNLSIATTSIFAGITMFVAHLSWLDPQITNLVPVLKSYWLTIHVSVITASYGFLGLSAMLGFISLLLFIMIGFGKDERVKEQIVLNIKESVRINELSMTVGLTLLIAGNFLGGIWANESWGRYWGWDPKETWTLVTVIVYAAIIHLRYIPKSNSIYLFNVLSLSAYSTVIMTYFGVNYYLTGLHSYATGDPVPVPIWIYYVGAVIVILSVAAFKNRNVIKQYKIKS